ncbi:MAG: hypothetical protein JXA38_01510 [Methanosarcinaceae archaeon]|nr:hypothetical protein [Methanosarcinaceae archaeon]
MAKILSAHIVDTYEDANALFNIAKSQSTSQFIKERDLMEENTDIPKVTLMQTPLNNENL